MTAVALSALAIIATEPGSAANGSDWGRETR